MCYVLYLWIIKVFNDLKIFPEGARKYRECMMSANLIYRSSIETLCIQSVSCKMALMMTIVLPTLDKDFETRQQILLDLASNKRRLAALNETQPEYAKFNSKVSKLQYPFRNQSYDRLKVKRCEADLKKVQSKIIATLDLMQTLKFDAK